MHDLHVPQPVMGPEGEAAARARLDALFARFNTLYGRLWTDGAVEQPTKEVARLRNARLVDCGL